MDEGRSGLGRALRSDVLRVGTRKAVPSGRDLRNAHKRLGDRPIHDGLAHLMIALALALPGRWHRLREGVAWSNRTARSMRAPRCLRAPRCQFIFSGKNDELTPDFRHRISPDFLRMTNCRVGKGRPAGSIELRVSPSPSKIPYGGFSPVRLQMDRQWRPSTTSRGLSAVHIRPMRPSYTPPQLQFPGIRDPRRDYPFENLSVQCGTTPNN